MKCFSSAVFYDIVFYSNGSSELEKITYSDQPKKEEEMTKAMKKAKEERAVKKEKVEMVKVPWYTHSARWAPMLKRA